MERSYLGIVILVLVVATTIGLASAHNIQDYWQKQEKSQALFNKGKYLEDSFETITQRYQEGKLAPDEYKRQLSSLSSQVKEHIKEVETEVKFLNVSHIYKSAKQLEANIEKEQAFLESIKA